jgi:hypothetical protein
MIPNWNFPCLSLLPRGASTPTSSSVTQGYVRIGLLHPFSNRIRLSNAPCSCSAFNVALDL